MASLSLNPNPLFFLSEFHNSRISNHSTHKFLKPPLIFSICIRKSFTFSTFHQPSYFSKNHYPHLQPFTNLYSSPNSFNRLQRLTQRFNLQKYTPNHSFISCSLSIRQRISKFFTEMIVVFLVGSFAFIGLLSSRSAVASPGQRSGRAETLEERKETQYDSSEDEEMHVKLVEGNPRNVDALKMVVNLKMKKGKTKEALLYVEKLIDVQPEEIEWRLLQALCYDMLGHFSKARSLFKEILKQRPLLIRALHGLAMVMHKNHEGPAVFEMLNKALDVAHRQKRVSEERNIKMLIAQMHVVKGQLEEALIEFQDLVVENPRDFRPYLCQGIIYSLLDKKEQAGEQFETYQSLVPEEFPQRGFLDDVVLAAKSESKQQPKEEFKSQFSYKK